MEEANGRMAWRNRNDFFNAKLSAASPHSTTTYAHIHVIHLFMCLCMHWASWNRECWIGGRVTMVHDCTVRDRHQPQRQEQHSAGRHSWFLRFVALNFRQQHTQSLTPSTRFGGSVHFILALSRFAARFCLRKLCSISFCSYLFSVHCFLNSMSGLSRLRLALPLPRFCSFFPHVAAWIYLGFLFCKL